MATRRVTGTITKNAIDQAAQTLQQLPDKPKHQLSLREAIGQMGESINAALARGYSYDEVAGLLKQQGVEISASTLKSYLAQSRAQTRAPGTRRGGRRKKVDADEAPTLSLPDEPAAKTRKPRQTAAKASKAPAKTVADAPKTRSTSVRRGRKPSK